MAETRVKTRGSAQPKETEKRKAGAQEGDQPHPSLKKTKKNQPKLSKRRGAKIPPRPPKKTNHEVSSRSSKKNLQSQTSPAPEGEVDSDETEGGTHLQQDKD
ncbi:MAG: hypothetical protein MMC33_005291 [Icmadophila ericetorum]|nr:hypothetical protein [Icmadophila ericetorum]